MTITRDVCDLYNRPPDARVDTWIWLYFRNRNGRQVCEYSDKFGYELAYAVGQVEYARLINSESQNYLLPAESLKWITKERRQYKWLLSYVNSKLRCDIADCPPRLEGRNRIIASLDVWECNLSEKSAALRDMESAWYATLREDDIFDWFKVEEALRVDFAWKWLIRKGRDKYFKGLPVSSHKELLGFYDDIAADATLKKLDVREIKASWSQVKHAKKKLAQGESQCNVWISDDAQSKLEDLCKRFDLSRGEIIEKLIKEEFDKGHYLRG